MIAETTGGRILDHYRRRSRSTHSATPNFAACPSRRGPRDGPGAQKVDVSGEMVGIAGHGRTATGS